jgi:hypothetical protein
MVIMRPKAVKSAHAIGVPTARSSPALLLITRKIQEIGSIVCPTSPLWRETGFVRFAALAIVSFQVSIVKSIQDNICPIRIYFKGY